jgi:hypothetical protein
MGRVQIAYSNQTGVFAVSILSPNTKKSTGFFGQNGVETGCFA